MNLKDKQFIFHSFLTQWGDHFNRLPDLFRFLDAYHSLGEEMDNIERIEAHELNESQMEWVSLVERFEHPLEKEFFKPYWIPISKDNYDYFLDLSANPFRIFKSGYWGVEPMHWYSEDVVPDVTEYLLSLEDGTTGFKNPIEDEYGNPLDQNGDQIVVQPSSFLDFLFPEFIGYDLVSINHQMTEVKGTILDSPIEERLIRQLGYNPLLDNSQKPYQAWWVIQDKKFMLHLVNAHINEKHYHTNDIVPEYDEFVNDDEIFFHYIGYSGTLVFTVDEIKEQGFFSQDLKVGDKIYITVNNGIVTDFDKEKS